MKKILTVCFVIKNGVITINKEKYNNCKLVDWTLVLDIIKKASDIENFYTYFNNYQKNVVESIC